MRAWLQKRMNGWVLLASLVVAGGLTALFILFVLYLPMTTSRTAQAPALLTIIPAPSVTPSPTKSLFTPTPTPPPSVGGIAVGNYVQISGTDGQGLRLRDGAGMISALRFLGMDAEVFLVKDGPKEADGFTWWYLVAPYDPARSGWAASQYLSVVKPTPTP